MAGSREHNTLAEISCLLAFPYAGQTVSFSRMLKCAFKSAMRTFSTTGRLGDLRPARHRPICQPVSEGVDQCCRRRPNVRTAGRNF